MWVDSVFPLLNHTYHLVSQKQSFPTMQQSLSRKCNISYLTLHYCDTSIPSFLPDSWYLSGAPCQMIVRCLPGAPPVICQPHQTSVRQVPHLHQTYISDRFLVDVWCTYGTAHVWWAYGKCLVCMHWCLGRKLEGLLSWSRWKIILDVLLNALWIQEKCGIKWCSICQRSRAWESCMKVISVFSIYTLIKAEAGHHSNCLSS